jgi:hypothetical protein
MMARALWVFVIVNVLAAALAGVALAMLQDKLGQFAGLIMLPIVIVPIVMAYVGHTVSGAPGNPFRGLVWGQTWWYFATWILGLLVAGLALLITFGLGAAGIDMTFSDYLRAVTEQAAKNSGQELPAAAMQTMSITAWATLISAPTIGAWIGGAVACLGSFAWLGWFTRRMLVYGRGTAVWTLIALYAATSTIGAISQNPMDQGWDALPLIARMSLMALAGMSAVPALLWLFFRTRSAVLPALAQASYQATFAGAMVLMSDRVSWLAPPNGLLAALGALLVGIALWVWKDPGGMDLAVAAVAIDGTPLTPEQVKALQAESPATPEQV